jgi:hypothetical protein
VKARKGGGGAPQPSQDTPYADSPRPDDAGETHGVELCYFCRELPSGASGHAGFFTQVYKIPSADRSFVPVNCSLCGSRWVRRRINARVFEWLRILD